MTFKGMRRGKEGGMEVMQMMREKREWWTKDWDVRGRGQMKNIKRIMAE